MKKVSNRLYIARKVTDYAIVLFLMAILLFIWQLYRGPINAPFLKPYIIAALNHDSENSEVSVESVHIEFVRSIKPLKIIADNVVFRQNDNSLRLSAPRVAVSFSMKAMLRGIVAPSSIEIDNPTAAIFTSYGLDKKDKASEITVKKLDYYVSSFEDFLDRFNSPDKTYSESYINDIVVNNGELEFHEVDLGRKWQFTDLNYHLERNLTNIATDASGFLNLNDRLITIGMDAEYRTYSNKLAVQLYFSDLVPADIIDNVVGADRRSDIYNINLPLSGQMAAMINFDEFQKNRLRLIEAIDTAVESVTFQFEGGNGNIVFAADDAKSQYDISSFVLEGRITGGLNKVSIKNADFNLGEQKVKLGFELEGLGPYLFSDLQKDLQLTLTADLERLKLDDLYVYWPRYIAPDAWEWCKDSIFGGYAKDAHFVFRFGYDEKSQKFDFLNISGGAYIEDSNLRYINTMPVVNNLYGEFSVDNTSINIALDKAVSSGIVLDSGNVRIYDLNKYNNYINIKLSADSDIGDVLRLIDSEPLKFTSQMGLDVDKIKGSALTDLELNFELRKDLGYDDVAVKVSSRLRDVVLSDIAAGKSATAEKLDLSVDNQGMQVRGDIVFDGMPAALSWDEYFDTKQKNRSRYVLAFKASPEELKQKWKLDYSVLQPPYISGYADVEADITVDWHEKMTVSLKAGLQNAAMNYSFLGFIKPLAEPANLAAELSLKQGKLLAVPLIKLRKDNFLLAGNLSVSGKGSVTGINITEIKGNKTSAGAKISLPQGKKGRYKISISGNSYNLAPFFDSSEKAAQSEPDSRDSGLKNVPDMDINIAVNTLWTNPEVSVRNFAGSAKLNKGIGIYELHLIGNYDRERTMNLKVDYVPRPNKEFLLDISSNHAGNTLKFLRIYNDMHGGNLQISGKCNQDGEIIGHAKIRDFSLHNTPLLTKLLTVASFTGMVDLLTGEGLTFSHFDAPFKYKNKLLSVKDAKTYGNVLGITFSGGYNMKNENVSISGMIAPAYGLNTMIGKIPLLGNLLAGKDGTVFAANYSITGTVSNPDISLNPLSALSPNSLKEAVSAVFGEQSDDF